MTYFLWGVFPYICFTLFLVVPIIRMATRPFSITTRASGLFGRDLLGAASLCLHWGLFTLLVAHLAGFVGGRMGWEPWVTFFYWAGMLGGLLTLAGSLIALARRVWHPEVRAMSQSDDYVVHVFLIVILSLALYQVLAHRLFGLAFTAAPWFAGIFTLSPQPELMASATIITKLHVLTALTFFAYFPFTKLVHLWSYPINYAVRPYQSMRTQRYVFEKNREVGLRTDRSFMVYAMVGLAAFFFTLSWMRAGMQTAEATPQTAYEGSKLHGEGLYVSQCARCHGVTGKGDGIGAGSTTFAALPRDLVSAKYHFVSTRNGVASDADLTRTIRYGLAASGMPAFSALSEAQLRSLVAYLRQLSPGQDAPGAAIEVPAPPVRTADVVARGKELFATNCTVCHGDNGRGDGVAARALFDARGRAVRPANLAAGMLKAGSDGEQVYVRIAAGIPGGKAGPLMPAFGERVPPQDIWAIVMFLQDRILPRSAVAR